MSKVKKIILRIAIAIIVICGGITFLIYSVLKNNDQRKAYAETFGSGDKKAFVMYQPSSTDVMKNITDNYVRGLVDAGYTVDVTYPDLEKEYDVSQYDLVSYGSPVYGGKALDIMKKCVEKITNYKDGIQVFLYTTGVDNKEKEMDGFKKAVQYSNVTTQKIYVNSKTKLEEAYEMGAGK
ncbi:flavodoxin domain-containing protein [[Clostridium] polysaccharolyticum]|uniref:Flavodoxin domain-containing protein n=1 Tax=[Clostridium] polysaccharolyticum TaxID=29364 RepID=A0A1I0EF03_9FIRM|nr:hypothetical protein [[Clostridium] polysaccharolyticum]SET43576.1 hypothetical protein SAMN04487772_12041 [[Clostridium] polysaccharolyticum]